MEAALMYYCMYRFNMMPPEYLKLSRREKAFITAAACIHSEKIKSKNG